MAVCPACATRNPRAARFCNGCGRPLSAATAEAAAEQRKVVTVLFIDLVGSTELGERLDPETVREVLTDYFALVRGAVEHHGGTIEKFIGDAAMAVFGVPTLREDDALRAARAALEVRDALPRLNADLAARLGVELAVRTGVNSGEVVAGSADSGPTLITGDTVNTAARLEQGAEPGEILLGLETARLLGPAVIVEPRAPLTAKGKAQPLEVVRLLAEAPQAAPGGRRLDTPLVGREKELARLRGAFETAQEEQRGIGVTVIGEAGVGKSRLVHEFVTETRPVATILRGRCLPYGQGITWWPIGEMVRGAAGIRADDARPAARRKLDRLLKGAEEAGAVAQHVASLIGLSDEAVPTEEAPWAVRRLFEHLAADRPLVVVADDVQWAEANLLDALDAATASRRERAIMVLTIARPEVAEVHPAWLTARRPNAMLRLGQLGQASVADLLKGLFPGGSVDVEVERRLATASEGNPLFVEQLAAYLLETGVLRNDAGRLAFAGDPMAFTIPTTIGTLLAARLDRLPPGERQLASVGAVIGREFDLPSVLELTPPRGVPGVRPGLAALLGREIILFSATLEGADAYRFRHLLLRDAAYNAMPKRERAGLHERFGDWLEQRYEGRLAEVVEVVGYHLDQAHRLSAELGDKGPAIEALAVRAGEHLAVAGETAWRRNDASAARHMLERACALLPPGPGHAAARCTLGHALQTLGFTDVAATVYTEARAEAEAWGDDRGAALIEVHQIRLMLRSDPERWFTNGPGDLRRLERILRAHGDDGGTGWALLLLGSRELYGGHQADGLRLHARALTYARRADDRYLEGRCLGAPAWASPDLLEPISRGVRRCQRVIHHPHADRQTRAGALSSMGRLLAMDGRSDRAIGACQEAIVIAVDLGSPNASAIAYDALGDAYLWAGEAPRAEAAYRSAVDQCRAIGDLVNVAGGLTRLARTIAMQGRATDAIACAEESERLAAPADLPCQAYWRATKARGLLLAGDLPTASRLVTEASALMAQTDYVTDQAQIWLDLADVCLAQGDGRGAIEASERAMAVYRIKESSVGIAWANERLELAAHVS